MSTTDTHGFTFIETMLFLAVTGALAVAILVGSGVAIGQQRYRDSVNTLKSTLQLQYNEVANTVNSRQANWSCDSSASASVDPTGEPRGTSECVLLGRFVTIDTGKTITISNVIGYRPVGPAGVSDVAELAAYNMSISTIDQQTLETSWQAVVVKQPAATPYSVSILIVRSPLSGAIKTFVTDSVVSSANIRSMVVPTNQSADKILCVAASQGTFVGKQIGVKIDAFASNQGAVNIPLETDGLCG